MNQGGLMRIMKAAAFETLGAFSCKQALTAQLERKPPSTLPIKARVAYYLLGGVSLFVPLDRMMREHEKAEIDRTQVYDQPLLELMLNRAYDMPEVVVDQSAPRRINVLVPAFTISTISAGFFGVFNTALFIAQQGYRVRLVLFDNFYYVEEEFRSALTKFPSMEELFDKVEVEYIGTRAKPLIVSPLDNCVATVWYSAYLANKIAGLCTGKPFVYLIQDFEAAFYPFNSLYCVSRNSYNFNYHTLASSDALLSYLVSERIISDSDNLKRISFNNACSSSIYARDDFFTQKSSGKKRFVFYSRPAVNRNMFEMAALALIHAYKAGAFQGEDWEFYGMGIGSTVVQLEDGVEVKQLPRMPLSEYEAITKTFDLCLTLMSSPHPSLIPMDLAASGAVVVTNTFETKTPEYLTGISANIVPAHPGLYELSAAIFQGVAMTKDLESRYENATINWPKSWSDTWTENHKSFINEVFSNGE